MYTNCKCTHCVVRLICWQYQFQQLYFILYSIILYSDSTLYFPLCSLYNVLLPLYIVACIIHVFPSLYYAVYTMYFRLCTIQSVLSTPFSVICHLTIYILMCIMYFTLRTHALVKFSESTARHRRIVSSINLSDVVSFHCTDLVHRQISCERNLIRLGLRI